MGLADHCDVLNSINTSDLSEKFKAAVYLREPILAMDYRPPIEKYLSKYLYSNKLAIKEIIGEIFSEEQRQLSLVYEGILRAIASGKRKSGEISSFLFSKKLLPKDNPGAIQRYLDNLVKMGLIEKIESNKRGFYYLINSPLFNLHFYLEEKYGYTEMDIPIKYIENVIKELMPKDIEKFIWDMLSKELGMKKIKIEKPELDIALKKFNRFVLVGEVKWKKSIRKKEIEKIESSLSQFDAQRILIVPDKEKVPEVKDLKILDIKDMIKICRGELKLEL